MKRVLSPIDKPEVASVTEQMRRFEERIMRMNDGKMAIRIAKLRSMTGQVPNPPIAGKS